MKRVASLLLAMVPVLGGVELGLHEYFAARAPDFQDYAALAPRLMELKRPGVPVVVSPSWAEPLVRQAAPEAFPIAELTRPDDSGFAQLLEVSLLGQRAPELARFPVREQRRLGAFELLLHANPRAKPPRFDFVTAVDVGAVEVFDQRGLQRLQCPLRQRARAVTGGLHGRVARPARRHECADGRLVAVSIIEDAAYRPHRCVLVDPPARGRIVLRFNGVPASDELVGFAGFSYFLGRDFQADAAVLALSADGRELGQQRVNPSRGWQRFAVPRGSEGVVEVSVSRLDTEPPDFCFALEAR